MKRTGFTTVVLIVGLVAFWGAGRRHPELLRLRSEYRIVAGEPLEDVPPLVAFTTVALGGFSGILADYLWVRSAQMQREGRYFEVVQLADWITKLEPRFVEAWVYHAWNLAYNISVMFPNPEERWRWVRHGVSLLRDEALRYNPANPALHRELAWLYFHKIGGDSDTAHGHYKQAFARDMSEVIHGGYPDYDELLQEPSGRAQRLRERYRLQPAIMMEVDHVFGPLDWRLPQTHAVYWLWRGRPFARGFERLATDRLIYQSMADLFYSGRYITQDEEGLFLTEPLLDVLPGAQTAFEQAVRDHPDVDSVRMAHAVFLQRAVLILFLHSRENEARRLFDQLHDRYPNEFTSQGFELFLFYEYLGYDLNLTDDQVLQAIERAFYDAYFWRALGLDERASGHEHLALLCWRLFIDPRLFDPEYRERMEELPSLELIRRRAFFDARASFRSEAVLNRLDEIEAHLRPID